MISKYDLAGKDNAERAKNLLIMAMKSRKKGYEIEAFSILYECIRFNQHRLISLKIKKYDEIVKEYRKLQSIIKNKCLLKQKRTQCMLGQFHTHRTKIVHHIIHNRNFDDKQLNNWFEFGEKLNLKLLDEIITKTKKPSIYHEIIDE